MKKEKPMKSIEINRFKIEDSEEMGIPVLTVYWTWLGPGSRTLLPKVKDLGFGCNETSVIPVRADHGLRYWSRFGKGTQFGAPDCTFRLGFRLEFWCQDSGELVQAEEFPFIRTDILSRSHAGLFQVDRPNLWMIGDSGASSFEMGSEKQDLEHGDWVVNHTTYLALSARRFARGNWRDLIKSIPIRKGDALAFMLGSWDIREVCGHALLKGVDSESIIEETVFQYIQTLQEIALIYPDNPVIAIAPNPPSRTDNLDPTRNLAKGSDAERLELWQLFNQRMEEAHSRKLVKYYWNTTLYYRDLDGFMRPELLWPKDTHIKLGKPVLNAIKRLIDCHLVKTDKTGSNK